MINIPLNEGEKIALNEQLILAQTRHQAALDTLTEYRKDIDESKTADELNLANIHYENAHETVMECVMKIQEITEELGRFVKLSPRTRTETPSCAN